MEISTEYITQRNEEIYLQKIFPEELWMKILLKIEPSSKEICQNSTALLHRLLSPIRQCFLFPQVWRILAPKFEKQYFPCYRNDDRSLGAPDRIFPIHKIVSNLRLVCEDWCSAIDDFYQNLANRFQFDDYHGEKHIGRWIQEPNSFSELSNHGERFLEHFQATHASTHKNPFLGRLMKIQFTHIFGAPEHLFQHIDAILKLYGHHLWHLYIRTDNSRESIQNNYLKIQSWLLNTPNLKTFKWSVTGIRLNELPAAENDQLTTQIESSPLQKLNNLKFLSLEVPRAIAEHFVQINDHVEMLQCDLPLRWNELGVTNLKRLSIQYGQAEVVQHLRAAQEFNWKLETLQLHFRDGTPFINWETLFPVLEFWKETLVEVDIVLPPAQTLDEVDLVVSSSLSLRLELVNVKKLKLTMHNLAGIDFILPTSNTLEELRCICWSALETPYEHAETISTLKKNQLVEFHWEELETNQVVGKHIWELFPKLKSVTAIHLPYGVWVPTGTTRTSRPLTTDVSYKWVRKTPS